MVRMLHMSFHKRFVIYMIEHYNEWDWRSALFTPPFEGSKTEAIQAVQDDPREFFCGCDCDKESNGACAGRPMKPDKFVEFVDGGAG